MNAAKADILITVMLGLLSRATQIGQLIQSARAQGRDVTEAELDDLVAGDAQARQALQAAIDAARSAP